MIVLGIDGALDGFSAAVTRDERVIVTQTLTGNRALEAGVGVIAEVLREAHTNASEIDRVAVGVGPGGFTGLRIAISYAKVLALAWKLPLVAISSFDVLEADVVRDRALCVVSGRPGVVSLRLRVGKDVSRASGPTHETVERLLPRSFSGPLAVFGRSEDVLAVLAERDVQVERITSQLSPAAAAAILARNRDPAHSPHEVRADYGELPAAKVKRAD